ncbi:MAG: DUF1385 domain-containing protein [Chloroflexi bacterium]|nr:DUF1385 domain-containing protein [Chloroflexota bacterium]
MPEYASDFDSRNASSTYGGQAVVEGVMMRGARAMAIAVRAPEGDIRVRSEQLRGIHTTPLRRVPFVRGVLVLAETLTLGGRALTWSSAVAAGEVDEHGNAKSLTAVERAFLVISMAMAIAIFFAGPVVATAWLDRHLEQWLVLTIEGAIRIGLLLGYIWMIGRSDDVRRVFQYHGAEHMTIAAYEDGRELTVPAVRRYPKEHPRCGTSFLLTVALVSVLVFAFAGTDPFWWRIASRLVLIPFIASVAYEAIRFAGFHQRWPVIRWLFAGNIALQYLTTRHPDDEHIQVALRAFEQLRTEERLAS